MDIIPQLTIPAIPWWIIAFGVVGGLVLLYEIFLGGM